MKKYIQKDLDEYSDESLKLELHRRQEARKLGNCDYCGRKLGSLPCHFAKRHKYGTTIAVGNGQQS